MTKPTLWQEKLHRKTQLLTFFLHTHFCAFIMHPTETVQIFSYCHGFFMDEEEIAMSNMIQLCMEKGSTFALKIIFMKFKDKTSFSIFKSRIFCFRLLFLFGFCGVFWVFFGLFWFFFPSEKSQASRKHCVPQHQSYLRMAFEEVVISTMAQLTFQVLPSSITE